jgi:hypothetical protein
MHKNTSILAIFTLVLGFVLTWSSADGNHDLSMKLLSSLETLLSLLQVITRLQQQEETATNGKPPTKQPSAAGNNQSD